MWSEIHFLLVSSTLLILINNPATQRMWYTKTIKNVMMTRETAITLNMTDFLRLSYDNET